MPHKQRLIESIRLVDGVAQLLPYHRERIERSLHYLGAKSFFCLEEYIQQIITQSDCELAGVYKLRFEYDTTALYEPSCVLYSPRVVSKLIPYEIQTIDCYTMKWADRQCLMPSVELSKHLLLEPESEVIFTYKGLLTDTRYSNIALELSEGQWFTPRTPLLKGTMRQYLLDSGKLQEADLGLEELANCRSFKLINAMLPLII